MRITLKSFNGTTISKHKVSEDEYYWKLIGEKGEIIDEVEKYNGRVLVLFDNDLDKLKVINHNPIKNSLYIRKKDLDIEK